jgi:hypothetical protein
MEGGHDLDPQDRFLCVCSPPFVPMTPKVPASSLLGGSVCKIVAVIIMIAGGNGDNGGSGGGGMLTTMEVSVAMVMMMARGNTCCSL